MYIQWKYDKAEKHTIISGQIQKITLTVMFEIICHNFWETDNTSYLRKCFEVQRKYSQNCPVWALFLVKIPDFLAG